MPVHVTVGIVLLLLVLLGQSARILKHYERAAVQRLKRAFLDFEAAAVDSRTRTRKQP